MGNCQKNQEEIRSIQVVPPHSFLQIKCQTWNKDYQGLYDYESKDVEKEEIKVKQSGLVVKQKKNIPFSFVPCDQISQEVVKALAPGIKFEVIRKQNIKGFIINTIRIEDKGEFVQKGIWEVVKSMRDKKYYLKQGDIIKLGRQKFKVKEKVLKENQQKDEQEINLINSKYAVYQNLTKQCNPSSSQNLTEQESSQIVCRVCLDPGIYTNPLITPCKCQGYLKYIHLQCLKTWLGKRLEPIVKTYSVVINWKPLVCELCTSHFMYKVYIDGKKHYTVQIPRPDKPYIVLQILSKSSNNYKVYNLISFSQKNRLKLGRKHDTDIKISDDISVSRSHATISFDSQSSQFILQDNSSKFGTLVLQKKIKIDQKIPIIFQVGPNLFNMRMIKGLDEPEDDNFSQSEKDSQNNNKNNSDYEQSQESQAKNQLQPEDLSPNLHRNIPGRQQQNQQSPSKSTLLAAIPIIVKEKIEQFSKKQEMQQKMDPQCRIQDRQKKQIQGVKQNQEKQEDYQKGEIQKLDNQQKLDNLQKLEEKKQNLFELLNNQKEQQDFKQILQ